MSDTRLYNYEIILTNTYCFGKKLDNLLISLVNMSDSMLSLAAQMSEKYQFDFKK
jgi:hypothetical protein